MEIPDANPLDGAASPIGIEPIDPALLREPIEFLFAEHYRQRAVLRHLDWIAQERPSKARARLVQVVLQFLRAELPAHVVDEEAELLPLLRERCGADAADAALLDALSAEHVADLARAKEVILGLQALTAARDAAPPPRFVAAARAFVDGHRRHLAWENAVILPLARRRLTEADRDALARRLAARRGIDLKANGAS